MHEYARTNPPGAATRYARGMPESEAVTSPSPFIQLAGAVPPHRTEHVTVRLWWPVPALMVTQVRGHLDAESARFLARALRDHLTSTKVRLVGFHDWTELMDYDSHARIVLTDVAREALPRSDGTHVLIASPLVAFGIRAASVILRNVHAYSTRTAFEGTLVSTVQRLAM
jgi:hypothetical protein